MLESKFDGGYTGFARVIRVQKLNIIHNKRREMDGMAVE